MLEDFIIALGNIEIRSIVVVSRIEILCSFNVLVGRSWTEWLSAASVVVAWTSAVVSWTTSVITAIASSVVARASSVASAVIPSVVARTSWTTLRLYVTLRFLGECTH